MDHQTQYFTTYANRDVGDRAGMVGGSSWNDIFGVEPYGCKRRFAISYMGNEQDFDFVEPVWTRRGKDLEDVILKMWAKKVGCKYKTFDQLAEEGEQFTGDVPSWSWPHLDAIAWDHPRVPRTFVVDAKCLFPKSCTELLTKGVSKGYAMQLNHYLAATGYDHGVLAILDFMNWEIHEVVYRFDPALWEEQKREAEKIIEQVAFLHKLDDILPNQNNGEPHKSCQTCRYFHSCRRMG